MVKSRLEQCASRPWSGWESWPASTRPSPCCGWHSGAVPACPAGVAGRKGVAALRAGNLVFLLYDWGLSRLIGMMTARLKLR